MEKLFINARAAILLSSKNQGTGKIDPSTYRVVVNIHPTNIALVSEALK
jgi:hypothetical protein